MFKKCTWGIVVLAFLSCGLNRLVADGNEELGPPVGLNVADGTTIVVEGTGLAETGQGTIDIVVPEDCPIQQVILYVQGRGRVADCETNPQPSATADVDGVSVDLESIGVACLADQNANTLPPDSFALRAELTGEGIVNLGANSISVEITSITNVSTTETGVEVKIDGAALFVICDDGGERCDIDIQDGLDFAFFDFSGDAQVTEPVQFNFPAANQDRSSEILAAIIGDGVPGRDDIIRVSSGGSTVDFCDLVDASEGAEFDTVSVPFTIPAGASSLTIELISDFCENLDERPDSLSWLTAGVCIRPPAGDIRGRVFCDIDGNGEDDGEPGVEGVQITLQGCEPADGENMVLTDANGEYAFLGIDAPDDCDVQIKRAGSDSLETVGKELCPDEDNRKDAPVDPGEVTIVDFCAEFPPGDPGQIGDTVYCDENDDGVQQGGEPGIPGVQVDIDCEGVFTDSQVTDADGMYLFVDIPAGLACEVAVNLPTGPVDKVPGNNCPIEFVGNDAITLDPGEIFLDADFCFIDPPCDDCKGGVTKLSVQYKGDKRRLRHRRKTTEGVSSSRVRWPRTRSSCSRVVATTTGSARRPASSSATTVTGTTTTTMTTTTARVTTTTTTTTARNAAAMTTTTTTTARNAAAMMTTTTTTTAGNAAAMTTTTMTTARNAAAMTTTTMTTTARNAAAMTTTTMTTTTAAGKSLSAAFPRTARSRSAPAW